MNILVIEDNPSRIRHFRQELIGAATTFTNTAEEGLALIRNRHFDVVFMDHDLEEYGPSPTKGAIVVREALKCPKCWKKKIWIIHSLNEKGNAQMFTSLRKAGACVISWPYAWRNPTLLDQVRSRFKQASLGR